MDLFLINTVMNGVWYFFTIVFLLYRFTSFFTTMYNTMQIGFRIFNGVRRCISYWKTDVTYDEIRIDNERGTLFGRFKKRCKRMYRLLVGGSEREFQYEDHVVDIFEEHQSSYTFQPPTPQPQPLAKTSLLDRQYNERVHNECASPSNYFQSVSLHHVVTIGQSQEGVGQPQESLYYNPAEDMYASIFTKKQDVPNSRHPKPASSLSQRLENRPANVRADELFASGGLTTKFLRDPHEADRPL
jgi:hypothetical protein